MTTLPEPHFVDRDPEQVLKEVVQTWEDITEVPLQPGQPEFLFLRIIAYRETLWRIALQEAAKQNLLRFSQFPMTDYLGELVATPRLDAQAARTTLEWSLAAPHGEDVLVPAGTRAATKDGRWKFATTEDVTIAAGSTTASVPALATVTGGGGNGYLPGQVTAIVDSVPLVVAVTNLTLTEGGAARESTERYIERIQLAPDASSAAGSKESYRFHALSASGAIVDVAPLNPVPGTTRLVLLTADGAPGPELIALVEQKVSDEIVRPMNDTLEVGGPTEVQWSLSARLVLWADADPDSVLSAASTAALDYATKRRERLGRSVILTQLIAALSVTGVYKVIIDDPTADLDVEDADWTNFQTLDVSVDSFTQEREHD